MWDYRETHSKFEKLKFGDIAHLIVVSSNLRHKKSKEQKRIKRNMGVEKEQQQIRHEKGVYAISDAACHIC